MKVNNMLFLEQSYNECENNYKKQISNNSWPWDIVVITSSNDIQKQTYEYEIEVRKQRNILPKSASFKVISDPNNKRVGSGGATLNVFLELKDIYGEELYNKKVLLIHSGGDSKRIPQYSARGKLFSSVPKKLYNYNISTVFDELMITLFQVPSRIKPGVLIVSGDVLMLFNPMQIDTKDNKVLAVSIKEKVSVGKDHGVFLSDEKGMLRRFLHKESESTLRNMKAVDTNDLVDIDTGCMYLNKDVIKDLISLIEVNGKIDNNLFNKYINDTNRLSFYGDLVYPFSKEASISEYLLMPSEGILDDNLIEIRKILFDKLSKYNMNIVKTYPSKFIHVGTSLEVKDLFLNASSEYSFLNWNTYVFTNNNIKDNSLINTYIEDKAKIGKYNLLENSYIDSKSIIGNNNILINIEGIVNIDDDTIIHVLPVNYNNKNMFVGRIYGINDNPKENNKYFGKDYKSIFNDLFDENTPLWSLPLFVLSESKKDALNDALILKKIVNNIETKEEYNTWKNSERLSLSETFLIASIQEDNLYNERNKNLIISKNILNDFYNNKDISKILDSINDNNKEEVINNIKSFKVDKEYKKYLLLNYLDKDKYEDECYKSINELIKNNNECVYNKIINKVNDNTNILSPVRINFAGGWSDTPPYCLENGGTVLNASISIDDVLPVSVSIKSTNEKTITFKSIDLEKEETISISDLDKQDLSIKDTFVLTKASLRILNIYKYYNKGLIITTHSSLPAGSGLGTSSILAGTIIKALVKHFSLDIKEEEIFTYVLYLEQLISTGGGWQDQIGALVPGIKLISTDKGYKQVFKIDKINNNDNIKILNERLVLIYTGQRRIVKNVLRKIMNKYIYNDENVKYIIKEIQRLALLMKFELEKGSIKEFCILLNRHFNLIKQLDEGVTNTCIDFIIDECNEYVDALHMAGAGGGGFIFAILKENYSKEDLESHLGSIFSDSGVKVYKASITF